MSFPFIKLWKYNKPGGVVNIPFPVTIYCTKNKCLCDLILKKDFLFVTTMLVAVGCSDSMTEESDSEQRIPIVFGTQVATRAVVENDKEGMDNFTLWGWVRESDGPKLFFDAVSVTPSGNYGEKRFWAVGRPYGFYAVHPEKMKEINVAT